MKTASTTGSVFQRAVHGVLQWALHGCCELHCNAGNILRHDLLKWGGAKDPRDLIAGVLGEESLQRAGCGCMPHVAGLLQHYGISATHSQ